MAMRHGVRIGEAGQAAAADDGEYRFDKRRRLQQPIDGKCRAAHRMVAKPGAGTVIAKEKSPAAHHVARSSRQCETDGAGAGDDDAAIAAGEGADAGGIGVIVGDDRGKGQMRGGNALDSNRGDETGKPEACVKTADVETGRSSRGACRLDDGGDRRIEILIDVGGTPDRLTELSAIGSADAGPAAAAAAIDSKEILGACIHDSIIPEQYQIGRQ